MPAKNDDKEVNFEELAMRYQQSFQKLNELVATMVHELRMPISTIQGFAELLSHGVEGSLTQEQEEDIKRIYNSANRISYITDALMEDAYIIRLQSNIQTLEVESSDIKSCIDTFLSTQSVKIEKYGHKFISVIPESLCVSASCKVCLKLIAELLNNAVLYTPPPGQINLLIKREGHFALFKVTDTGVGIPEDELEHIFRYWFRGKHEIIRKHNNLGAGLYRVKQLVTLYGGTIGMESEVGRGSIFWFTLPLADADEEE
ncbi:MAG: HAMP domain-containing histidine kinase [Ardenticatenaceae bacterium]|nr:HAMP domain-containing histidine kinase [Ardenticatenaceae bacterium]